MNLYEKKSDSVSPVSSDAWSHDEIIDQYLQLLKFLLNEGQLRLAWREFERIWNCLFETPLSPRDVQVGFDWLSEALSLDDADVDSESQEQLFRSKFPAFSPALLTTEGV